MLRFIFWVCTLGFIATLVMFRSERKHEVIDGKAQGALHLALPGINKDIVPAREIDLSKWIGTHYDNIEVKVDGEQNAEATAGLALKHTIYPEYDLKQKDDGTWILHKPAEVHEYWTTKHYYKVGPWSED